MRMEEKNASSFDGRKIMTKKFLRPFTLSIIPNSFRRFAFMDVHLLCEFLPLILLNLAFIFQY